MGCPTSEVIFAASQSGILDRSEDAGYALKASGFVLTFRITPEPCFCANQISDPNDTPGPLSHSIYVYDEDGDPIYTSTFHSREAAIAGIEAQMKSEEVDSWAILTDDGAIELFGAIADAFLDEDEIPIAA